MRLDRRQMLQALGFGAVSSFLPGRSALGSDPSFPTRIVFYVQPHGHIPDAFRMDIPGGPTDRFAERALGPLALGDMSATLGPLHPYREKLLAIEGLSNTSILANIEKAKREGGDVNNHQVGVAGILTGSYALQRQGQYCTGGAPSIDQVLASRSPSSVRFGSRVYGTDYVPNSVVSPFSYLGAGQATPEVSNPAQAFSDLLGYLLPPGADNTREARLHALRPSVLDAASREYEALAPRLGREGREKLDQHRQLVRELETSISTPHNGMQCGTTFDAQQHPVRQFMSLVRLAFACDLTRVVTFTAPVPETTELAYSASTTFHTFGHASIKGATSCGSVYDPLAAEAMTKLDHWNAEHFAALLGELDAVKEGSGTLLDHTVVVWLTELATPTHTHHNTFTVLAGGANGFLKTGRYVRYPQSFANGGWPLPIGLPSNRLLVTLMQAMGYDDTTFGLPEATGYDGSTVSFRGPLPELIA